MKAAILGLLILLGGITQAYAERIVGNGGDAVVCRDTSGNIQKVELLDFYEGTYDYKYQYDLGPSEDIYERVRVALRRLERVAPESWMDVVKNYLWNFEKEASYLDDIELDPVDDSDHVHIPRNCELEQLAVQRKPIEPKERRYNIDNFLFEKMEKNHQAGLVLHEILYRLGLGLGQENSRGIRKLVSWISTNQFENVTRNEFLYFISRYDMSSPIDYPSIHLDFRTAHYDENGILVSALVHPNKESFFPSGDNLIYLGIGSKVEFKYNPDTAKNTIRFVDYGENDSNFKGTIKIKFWDFEGHIDATSLRFFFENGMPKSFTAKDNFDYHGISYRAGDVDFYRDGQIKEAHLLGRTKFTVDKQDFYLHEEIEYYPTGALKSGELSEASIIRVWGEDVFGGTHPNIEFYPGGALKSVPLEYDRYSFYRGHHYHNVLNLFENGDVEKANVPKKEEFFVGGGSKVYVGDRYPVEFYPSGVFKSGKLVEPFEMIFEGENLKLLPGCSVDFHENGKLYSVFCVGTPHPVRVSLPFGIVGLTIIFTRNNGDFSSGVLFESQYVHLFMGKVLIRGGVSRKDSFFRFNSGKDQTVTINGVSISLKYKQSFDVYDDGTVKFPEE